MDPTRILHLNLQNFKNKNKVDYFHIVHILINKIFEYQIDVYVYHQIKMLKFSFLSLYFSTHTFHRIFDLVNYQKPDTNKIKAVHVNIQYYLSCHSIQIP